MTRAAYEVPDRSHLVGRMVKLKLHRWALTGPRKGIFLGQGERGLSIRAAGGGRYVYLHHEVKAVRPV